MQDICPMQVIKEPTVPMPTELSYISSYGSNHSDLSDGVPLWCRHSCLSPDWPSVLTPLNPTDCGNNSNSEWFLRFLQQAQRWTTLLCCCRGEYTDREPSDRWHLLKELLVLSKSLLVEWAQFIYRLKPWWTSTVWKWNETCSSDDSNNT